MHYDYPATFFSPTAVHSALLRFFTDLHPVANAADARDYVARLRKVKAKLGQLVDELRVREREGVMPPRFAVEWALPGVYQLAHAEPDHSPFYTAFRDKVQALTSLDQAQKRALLEDAKRAVRQSVMPGYSALERELEHQLSVAPEEVGLSHLPDGGEYYAFLLQHYTTTDMTADEIHELGLAELERIHAEMRAAFDELGYPESESLPELFDRVEDAGGYVAAERVIETYDSLLRHAESRLGEAFSTLPHAGVLVIRSPIKGMYTGPSADGSRPGAFHAGMGQQPEAYFAMPTLTYHETVPGHHLQIALAAEADLPLFRKMTTFLGYTEGWALYAEQLAWELGWYEGDPYGNLGRLQAEAFRAARLVVDTGLHDRGWTFEEAVDFFTETTGFEDGDSVSPTNQVARYVVWPGQATAYKVGMLRLLELREEARWAVGNRFDLKEFHRVVLENGSMPLDVLERVVEGYIEQSR